MENSEEIHQILERYTRLKQKEIPKELEDYLEYVAKTGDTVFKWSSLKYLFREKLLNVIKNFNEDSPRLEEIPNYPNVDPFNYEAMKSSLLERLDLFNAAPFTVQRLCELLIEPRKQYTRIDKFMRALEKNILVVSTVQPGRKRAESENGDSLDSVVNGDLSLEVNIDIEMENEALFNNADERNISGNAISPLKALNPRPDDDLVEPKAKKVKLSCGGKGIDDLDKALSAEYAAEAREAEARRVAKANLPETPDEPDEEDDEIYEPTPAHVKLCSERAKQSSSERERIEKSNESDKFAEVEKNDVVKLLPKDGINGDDDDEKVIEKQEIEKCEKNKDEHDDLKDDDNEDEAIRIAPVESEQIASPSPERDVVDILGQADEEEDAKDTRKPLNSNINDNGDDQVKNDADTVAVCEKEKADDAAKTETDTEIRETANAAAAAAAAVAAAAIVATNAIADDKKTESKTKELLNENKTEKDDTKIDAKQDETKDDETNVPIGNENESLAKDTQNPKTEDGQQEPKAAADEKSTEPATTIKITEGNEKEEDVVASTVTTSQAPQTVAAKDADENAHEPVPIETDEPPPTPAVVAVEIAAATVAAEPNQLLATNCVDQVVTVEPPEPVVNAISTDAAAVALPSSSDVDTTSAVADQPMDEEQQVSPNAVEEVVMAELNKDEPAGMEVDDTSQEAMDQ